MILYAYIPYMKRMSLARLPLTPIPLLLTRVTFLIYASFVYAHLTATSVRLLVDVHIWYATRWPCTHT
jgi:hypothetical protein